MSEESIVAAVQAAVDREGFGDTIQAAGQFEPRGHVGSMFAGGMIGGSVGDEIGGVADSIGTVAGALGGAALHDSSSGLPSDMLVGVSETTVYGFAGKSRHKEPHQLVFRVAREGLTVKVHQRVNVRVLELIHEDSGSRIELEGGRIPLTHSKDVISLLES
jgi:hypothetical protein